MRNLLVGIILFGISLLVHGDDGPDVTDVCLDARPLRLTASNRKKIIDFRGGHGHSNRRISCKWLIQTEIACGYAVNIQLGGRRKSGGDTLYATITDGPSTNAVRISSQGWPRNVTSSGQFAFINFRKSWGRARLYVRYRMVKRPKIEEQSQRWTRRDWTAHTQSCYVGRTPLLVATSRKDYIMSEGFNIQRLYPRNQQCSYMLTADNACQGVIKITLENMTLASQDLLQIYDGSSSDDVLLASLIERKSHSVLISKGPKVLITFTSGNGTKKVGQGFKLSYESALGYPMFLQQSHQSVEGSVGIVTSSFLSSTPVASVTWFKDGNIVHEDTEFGNNAKGREYYSTLRLSPVQEDSFGTYKVSARNAYGIAEQYVDFKQPSTVPKIGNFTSNVDMDRLIIKVELYASQEFNVSWFKNDVQLNDNAKYTSAVTKCDKADHYIADLQVSSLTTEDFDVYQIRVQNQHATAESNVPVSYPEQYIPKIRFYNVTIVKDANVFIMFESNPLVDTVTWYKDGIQLKNGTKYSTTLNILTVYDVSDEDFGKYQVSVTNAAGTGSRNIQLVKPKVCPTYITCNQSHPVTVTCQVESCSSKSLRWIHSINGTELRRIEGVDEGIVNTLTLPFCVADDVGTYTCVEEGEHLNGMNKEVKHGSVYIDPQAPPLIGPDAHVVSTEDLLVITVNVQSAQPITILKWANQGSSAYKEYDDATIRKQVITMRIRQKSVSLSGFNISLSIRTPEYDDYGCHIIQVRNAAGISSRVIEVKHEKAGNPVMDDNAIITMTETKAEVRIRFVSIPAFESVEWKDDTGAVLNSSRYTMDIQREGQEQFTAHLIITNYIDQDFQAYTFTVRNEMGYSDYVVKLSNPKEGAPIFYNYSRSVSEDGTSAVLAVNFTSNSPNENVIWYQGDVIVNPSEEKFTVMTKAGAVILDESGDLVNGYITTLSIVNPDNAIYKVRLQNKAGYTDVIVNTEQGCSDIDSV